MYKIYIYTNVINGKVYIGQTSKTLFERAGKNGSNYKECRRFYNAILKYGWDSFTPKIIADNLTLKEANKLEEYYIKLYGSTNPDIGYNIMFGGENREMSETTKEIISVKASARYTNPSNNPMFGKHHNKDTLLKMSKAKQGKNNPMFGSKWNSIQKNANRKGWCYEWTAERRKAMSDKMKKQSKEWVKRVICVEDNLQFSSLTEAANYYNVSKSTLFGHINGNQKTCKGKHFKFCSSN